MSTIASLLVTASAAIVLLLGLIHLLFTFHGPNLTPRDRDLRARMQEDSPVITRQTTMWKAWVGFNATHSLGLILFGVLYGYLALAHGAFLFASSFLLGLGLLTLLAYALLARAFFFRAPLRGVLAATVLYVLAMIVARSA
jgi:hypothetical protein